MPSQSTKRDLLPAPLLFALLFCALWLLHAPLLRLPYFWDEAGYFVPAARDLLLTGDLIPASTLSNAHPPLVMAWLAFWWKFSAYTPAVTRTAMLLVAAFTLAGVFRLAREVSNLHVAVAATALTAFYPVFFAQSSLAHLDMMAAGFTIWGLAFYLRGTRGRALALFALAGLAKETALITPCALLAWEILCPLLFRSTQAEGAFGHRGLWRTLSLALPCLPLAGWLAYHYFRTGIVFGNPEYFRYNVGATLHLVRFALALAQRLWQLFGYLNLFVLTGAAAVAMFSPPVSDGGPPAEDRPRIALSVQWVFGVVILAYGIALSVVGGALLARYLLPVYPLVILEAVATLWRRVRWWMVATGVVAAAFVAGLFTYPPYRFAPEDNLAYADFVRVHKQAALWLARLPNAPRVLTAWPATDELQKPYLGYLKHAIAVTPVDDFTDRHLADALSALPPQRFDYALIFPTKYEPAHAMPAWWERLQVRYFDYHRDATSEEAATILHGDVVYRAQRGGEWIAIIAVTAR